MAGVKEILKKNTVIYDLYKWLKTKNLGNPKKKSLDDIVSYYANRFKKYSGCFHPTSQTEMAYLTWLYHVIEKGLAMPNMKKGFGKEKLLELCDLVEALGEKGATRNNAFCSAVSTILEYKRIHDECHYVLDIDVQKKVACICEKYRNIQPLNQQEWSYDLFYNQSINSFTDFAASRHSIRHFDSKNEVKTADILRAIETANFAPSACNRQPTRLHVIETPSLIEKCMSLQNGNRGFGHLTNKLIVVTGDLQTVLLTQEFFDLYTNVGIYIMNLSYALHEQKIAHCILNWYATPNIDRDLRKLLNLPDEENVVAFIACGRAPERFKIVCSPRNEIKEVYTIH